MPCVRSSINSFLHSARILGDACEKFAGILDRRYETQSQTHRRNGRPLFDARDRTEPVIGYDKASAIAHAANDRTRP